MSTLEWLLVVGGAVLAAYLALVTGLFVAGRRADARALGGFVPDCIVLFRRLLGDRRIAGWRRLLLFALVGYLAMPVDVVPDFIPVVGQLDDAIVAALVLRLVLRAGGPDLVREHWPGPARSLDVLVRLAYGRSR